MSRIWVAMSGGVDSSVAAALLLEEGHSVTGITLRLTDPPSPCADPAASAAAVCEHLGIPHVVVEARTEFEADVVSPFCRSYAVGQTPNPCIDCNTRIKFGYLLDYALAAKVDALATGHYARVERRGDGTPLVGRARDRHKDQSYFLYRLQPAQLRHIMFPLGGLSKGEVRTIASERALPAAFRDESQDVCFVRDDGAAAFVGARIPSALEEGQFVDSAGVVVGTHRGVARYTVGQRKGLGIAGADPRYVTSIDARAGRVVVGGIEDLDVTTIVARHPIWHGEAEERVEAVVRYRGTPTSARARFGSDLTVELDSPIRGVAPGQAVVCYQQDAVIGGGVIATTS